jgi:hypothetical protein
MDTLRTMAAAGADVGPLPPEQDRLSRMPPAEVFKSVRRDNWIFYSELVPWADALAGQWHHDPEHNSVVAHIALSDLYRAKWEAGDQLAPFKYARRDAWAERAPWVIRVKERWRNQGRVELLEKFATALAGRDGERRPETILQDILDDLHVMAVYCDVVDELKASPERARRAHRRVRLGKMAVLERVGDQVALDGGRRLGVDALANVRDRYLGWWQLVEPLGAHADLRAFITDLLNHASRMVTESGLRVSVRVRRR